MRLKRIKARTKVKTESESEEEDSRLEEEKSEHGKEERELAKVIRKCLQVGRLTKEKKTRDQD